MLLVGRITLLPMWAFAAIPTDFADQAKVDECLALQILLAVALLDLQTVAPRPGLSVYNLTRLMSSSFASALHRYTNCCIVRFLFVHFIASSGLHVCTTMHILQQAQAARTMLPSKHSNAPKQRKVKVVQA